ncbi:MAG TPA: cytochrome b/b6 domain-containing protein [Acidobacteriota bacterium]|nr:cytochrome b/b6 domain-containing protein [Acidobacteriota bacterium]
MAKERDLLSIETFVRQLAIELEDELLAELEIRRTRELKRVLRDAIRETLDGRFRAGLRDDIESARSEARAAIAPVIEEIKERQRPRKEERQFQRISLSVRLQHMLMAVSVVFLIVTGLPLKFPDIGISQAVMQLMGGIQNSTLIHRIAACGLITVGVWHLIYIIFFPPGRRDFTLMLPNLKDVRDFGQMMMFYFGRRGEKPRFGRFSYVEKFDYWAVYWGCIIMIGTGILLWSPEFTFSYFPKYLYDIAKEVHSDEALLATLAIVIWHFYNVHFNPSVFPGSLLWFHGRLPEHEIKEEHPLEYEEIIAKEAAEAEAKTEGKG